MSQMSAIRQDFEINESKRALDSKIGKCISFAYPYGVQGTYDNSAHAQGLKGRVQVRISFPF